MFRLQSSKIFINQFKICSHPIIPSQPFFKAPSKFSNFSQSRSSTETTKSTKFPFKYISLIIAPASLIYYKHLKDEEEKERLMEEKVRQQQREREESMIIENRIIQKEKSKFAFFKILVRIFQLSITFFPTAITLPFVWLLPKIPGLRSYKETINSFWWYLLAGELESAGPLWMKLGQWAATRPDLFSEESCEQLSKLHNHCPHHSFEESKEILNKSLQQPLEEVFVDFEKEALASGAIAQVHRGTLKDGTQVAVKVRHPNTAPSVYLDLAILSFFSRMMNKIPGVEFLSVVDAVEQFTINMLAQLDLRLEANHLDTFRFNFRKQNEVVFPKPIHELTTESVLVETYEPGEGISKYLAGNQNSFTKKLAEMGIKAYLKMMLHDHYLHADLHPGNILVRKTGNDVQLVFLDVGLVTDMSATDMEHLSELLKAIIKGNGEYGAELMIRYAPIPPKLSPEREEEFKRQMADVFNTALQQKLSEIDVGKLLSTMMSLTRNYGVKLEGNFATLVVGTVLLEGLGRQLDSDINLLQSVVPYLFDNKQTELSKWDLISAYVKRLLSIKQ